MAILEIVKIMKVVKVKNLTVELCERDCYRNAVSCICTGLKLNAKLEFRKQVRNQTEFGYE